VSDSERRREDDEKVTTLIPLSTVDIGGPTYARRYAVIPVVITCLHVLFIIMGVKRNQDTTQYTEGTIHRVLYY